MVAAKLANLQAGQRADYANKTAAVEISTAAVTLERAAELMNVNRATVSSARKVLAKGTQEEIRSVQDGKAAVRNSQTLPRRGCRNFHTRSKQVQECASRATYRATARSTLWSL